MFVCTSSPVCSCRGDTAAPDWQATSASGSVILASVQVAHLHELLLADIIHHILYTQTHTVRTIILRQKKKRKKRNGKVTVQTQKIERKGDSVERGVMNKRVKSFPSCSKHATPPNG